MKPFVRLNIPIDLLLGLQKDLNKLFNDIPNIQCRFFYPFSEFN